MNDNLKVPDSADQTVPLPILLGSAVPPANGSAVPPANGSVPPPIGGVPVNGSVPADGSAPTAGGITSAWRGAWRTLALLVLALVAATAASDFGSRQSPHLSEKLIAGGGALAFLVLSVTAIFGIGGYIRDLAQPRVGSAHAVVLRLITILGGGFICLLVTLQLLAVPITQLVLGGALTGVVFGIAGQQTLANLFAGIVLLLARPFTVGQEVRLRSGALGGFVDGVVLEIGLAYLRLESAEGILSIPNSQVLNAVSGPRPVEEVP